MTNIAQWQSNYEALKVHVVEVGHFPNRYTKPNNWYRY